MRKPSCNSGQTCPKAFQSALDALDVIGKWEWDAATDCARSCAFVALLFNVEPERAATGVPQAAYLDAIHADDRERVLSLIRSCASEGSIFLTEYRVHSADGQTRWVLDRGHFTTDHQGRMIGGSGILVDITALRASESTPTEARPNLGESPLDRAAEHAIAVHGAIAALQDSDLKALADALLLSLGRRLAQREVTDRRRRLN